MVDEIKVKKKRGRKPKKKEVIEEKNMVKENSNNIIHLKINKKNDSELESYDKDSIYYEFKDLKVDDNNKNNYCKLNSYPYDNFISNNNNKNIHCYWCCHSFNTTVFTLPTKYENEIYYVYGCFCSPECACAYNFNDYKERYNMWERYSLLNMLYRKVLNDDKLEIISALPRETLKIFGGMYNIEEFRKNNKNYNKRIELLNYPLVSYDIIQNEIDMNYYIENKDKKKYIPLNQNIIEDNNNLKLKRKKPLNVNKNTLEKCMNLKYN